MVDIEQGKFVEPGAEQRRQRLGADLLPGLGEDLAGGRVEQVFGDILAVEILVLHPQGLDALLGQ